MLVLPLVLLVGLATYARLLEADIEDAWLVVGMNRLRHAYAGLVPGIERYFVTGYHDDEASLLQTYGFGRHIGAIHLFGGSPVIVAFVNAVVSGVTAVIIASTFDAADWLQVAAGVVAAVSVAVMLISIFVRRLRRFRREFVPQFSSARGGLIDVVKRAAISLRMFSRVARQAHVPEVTGSNCNPFGQGAVDGCA